MANKDRKSWREKFRKGRTALAEAVTIFGILGITIFGGVGLFGENGVIKGPVSTSENTEAPQLQQYHRGVIHDNSWESKFIGLRYTALDGMSMSTEEELDSWIELDRENLSKSFSQNELGYIDLTTVLEMKSEATDKPLLVEICVERVMEQVDLSQFIEGFESQFLRPSDINFTLLSDDESVKIGKEYYIKGSYIIDRNNYFRYMDCYFRIVGDRVIMIELVFDEESARDDLLDAFTAY